MNNEKKESNKPTKSVKQLELELSYLLWNHCVPYHPDTTMIPNMIKGIETDKQIGNYSLGETIGYGSFAVVKYCTSITGENLVIKLIDKSCVTSVGQAKRISTEIYALNVLQSEYITNLHDIIHSESYIALVLDSGPPDLYNYIELNRDGIEESIVKKIVKNILIAIQFCHEKYIYHLDLKPENILLDVIKDYRIVLCDFGLCNFSRSDNMSITNGMVGSPGFFAPEMKIKNEYSVEKADVWSIGAITLEMMCGHELFFDVWLKRYYIMVDNKVFKKNIQTAVQDILQNDSWSTELTDFFTAIFKENPFERPSIMELLRHPWIITPTPPATRPLSKRNKLRLNKFINFQL